MNKEGLAKIYANSKFKNCMYGCDPNILTDYDSIKDGFTAGFNAAEEETIRFSEWCSSEYFKFQHGWSSKRARTGGMLRPETFTTAQLLEKFREIKNPDQ